MDKHNFDLLVKSVKEMKLILKGKIKPTRVTKFNPISIKTIRQELGQSQTEFAFMIGVSPSTLRNLEQGLRKPDGSANVLLKIVQKNPQAVFHAVHS